jgi:hypothetical protein
MLADNEHEIDWVDAGALPQNQPQRRAGDDEATSRPLDPKPRGPSMFGRRQQPAEFLDLTVIRLE